MEKHDVYFGKEDIKGNIVMDAYVSDEHQEQVPRERSRTRGLKRALQQQREQMTFVDLTEAEINEDREFWLDKVNCHLEKILRRANRDKRLQKHMASHYYTRNLIFIVKVKKLKEKLNETLISQKEKGKLDLLVDASMIVH